MALDTVQEATVRPYSLALSLLQPFTALDTGWHTCTVQLGLCMTMPVPLRHAGYMAGPLLK